MKRHLTLALLLFFMLQFPAPAGAESVLGMLEGIGSAANAINREILGEPEESYASQIQALRQLEAARVREMAAVTGVNPDILRQMRANGDTWQQIADKYNVNLSSLPAPQIP